MRKSSTGRSSSSNPVRISTFDREDKSVGRSDAKRTQFLKSKGQTQTDNSQIPRPKIRSSSSERSSIRRSNLKVSARTPLSQPRHPVSRISNTTPITPRISSNRLNPEPSSGTRHRSPSAERATGFGAKGPRKDTRPLLDKGYQTAMLNRIDQYFADIQQISLLNPNGSLKPITLKIFVETTGCLSRLLDIKQDVTINNYTEEVPKIAKKIHYPGIVTKSWLKTANTMHSWPQVLGWLSWLVEVCDAKDLAACSFQIERLPFVGNNDEGKNRMRFLAMLQFYAVWNEDNLDEEAALVEQYLQELNDQYGDIDKDIEDEKLNLEKVKVSIQAVDQKASELDKEVDNLKQILDSLKQEDCQALEYIDSTEACTQCIQLEIKQLKVDSKTLEDEIQKDIVQQAELNRLVENQPMSINERDSIINQCSEIQNNLHQFDNHIQDIEKELYAMDLKFAGVNQNLYKAILAYNKDIIMHLSCDLEMDVSLEELKMPEANMLSDDFMEILRTKESAMLNVKERIIKQIGQTESFTDTQMNELETLRDKLNTLREENKHHVAKINEQKITVQQIQRKAKEAEAKLKEQIKSVETDLVKLQRSIPDLDAARNELAEARDKYEAVVRRKQFIEKSADRFFNKFYQTLANHRNDLSNLLKQLQKRNP